MLTLVNFHGYYSTSTSTKLQEDIELVSEIDPQEPFPLDELLKNIGKRKKGATRIEWKDLERGIERM